MRQALAIVLLLVLLPLLSGRAAFAEDETPKPETPKPETPKSEEPQGEDPAPEPEPKPEPEPDPEVPVYSIEFLMPGEDDAPDGWKIRDSGAPAGSPTEALLEKMSAACSCGLDEDTFYFETAVYKSGSAKVGVAMVDMDKSVWTFRQKVNAAAEANGWTVLELGAKGRLLIVGAGEKQAEVGAALKEHVVYQLGHLAMNRVRGRSGGQEEGREAAITYSRAIGRIAPDSGIAHAVVGVVHWLQARQGLKKGEKPKPAEEKLCAAAWHKAFAEDAAFPPRKSVRVFCAGEYGNMLLMKQDKGVLAEATRVLQIAVDHEREGKSVSKRFGNRYNLACSHARAGAIDEAFKMLRAALETASSMKVHEFRPQFKHIDEKDADMGPLREDPRFSKLMAEFRPAPPKKKKSPHGNPHGKK